MTLSVLVPAYNEERTIAVVIQKLPQIKEVTEIIVVDDASTDNTLKLADEIHDPKIKLYKQAKNLGKGAAIQSGLERVTGDYVLIQDADLEYDPRDIPALLQPIHDGRVEVVFGSRFIGARTNMFYWHYLGNIFLNWVVNICYNTILTDMETGYKLLPTKLMKSLVLRSNDFRIEPEITCKLLKRRVKIMEVPITYAGRSYAEGKKITWVDGFKALEVIFKLLVT